jgi:stress-induced morphogen
MAAMTADQIAERIRAAFPDAKVQVRDMTGTRDHWEVTVTSAAFVGKTPIARHRMVYDLFSAELQGPIHALTLQTLTP